VRDVNVERRQLHGCAGSPHPNGQTSSAKTYLLRPPLAVVDDGSWPELLALLVDDVLLVLVDDVLLVDVLLPPLASTVPEEEPLALLDEDGSLVAPPHAAATSAGRSSCKR